MIEATRGEFLCGSFDGPLNSISTDTRQIRPGDCFVALPGENHDGHAFVAGALTAGAGAVIVSRPLHDLSLPDGVEASVIRVSDTLYALGELARYHRRRFSIPVVGITGSNGKTSSKEMVAAILGQRRQVLKNKGNFNNLIGAPLTLLSLDPHHQVAVVEMGINVPGEMARLVEIGSPTVGLITGIHPAHLEGLHSLDLILEEKGKLWAGLRQEELAVVNLDDDRLRNFSKKVKARKITYSLKDEAADVKLTSGVDIDGSASIFQMALGGANISIRLPVLGLHQVQNALAAAAVAWGMGESPESVASGLSLHRPVRQRMEMHPLKDGGMILDDTYNANPRSMLAAVETALAASRGKPVMAVLGEMRELGPEGASLHREVGRQVAALGVSRLVALGELGGEIIRGAREGSFAPEACFHAGSHEEAVAWLSRQPIGNAWIVVKGSRAMAMERVVEGILGA